MNQAEKRLQIRASWCQNGDKNRGVEFKLNVKLCITKSYEMEIFLCHSMFNPMTTFSADWFKIPEFDVFLMSEHVIRPFFLITM